MAIDFIQSYKLITWDIGSKLINVSYFGKEGDTGRGLKVKLVQNSVVVTPTTEALRLYIKKPDNTSVYIDGVLNGNVYDFTLTNQVYAVAGDVKAELQLSNGTSWITSDTFVIIANNNLVDGSVESSNDFIALQATLGRFDLYDSQLARKATKSEVDVERQRINAFTSLAAGSTTGDAELIDIKVGANGVIYDNAGGAVRGQFNESNERINGLYSEASILNEIVVNEPAGTFAHEFKTGEKYVINITSDNPLVTLQFGTLSNSVYVDSSPIMQSTSGVEYYVMTITGDATHFLVYTVKEEGVTTNVTFDIYQMQNMNDKMLGVENDVKSINSLLIDETNYKESILSDAVAPLTAGCKFVTGEKYHVTIKTDNALTQLQFGTLKNSAYVDNSPLYTNSDGVVDYELNITGDADYFTVYAIKQTGVTTTVTADLTKIINVKETLTQDIEELQSKLSAIKGGNSIAISEFNGIVTSKIKCEKWTQNADNISLSHSESDALFSDSAILQTYCTAYNKSLIYDFSPLGASKVVAHTQSADVENFFSQGWCVSVDFANKIFAIHNNYGSSTTGVSNILPSVYKQAAFTVGIYVGEKFRIVLSRGEARNLIATLISLSDYTVLATIDTDFDSSIVPVYGLGYDYPAFTVLSNGCKLYSIKVTSKNSSNCFLYIVGDSITEGVCVLPENAWAYKVANLIPNTVVSGRGGGNINGVIRKITDEASILKPKYIMVTIGTNGGNTTETLTSLISAIESIGAIPIINTISCISTSIQSTINNAIIALNKKGARMDIATALNYDLSQGSDATLFESDGTHPNEQGHERMFKRVLIDLPELF